MELSEALGDITAIRRQLARSETFRGYRALPVALSGGLAFAAGSIQPIVVPWPGIQFERYLALWIGVAAVSLVLCLGDVWRRYRKVDRSFHLETTRQTIGQFLPCIVAGGAITAVLAASAPDQCRLLPGLWAVLFSLGMFASWRWLPRPIGFAAAYYLIAGLFVLGVGEHAAFSPLVMPLVFGVGQCLTALILWGCERPTSGETL